MTEAFPAMEKAIRELGILKSELATHADVIKTEGSQRV